MPGRHRYGVDHGLTFHVEGKLRTVLWGWLGETLSEEERDGVSRVGAGLDGEPGRQLAGLLRRPGDRGPHRALHPVARRRDLPGTERGTPDALAAVLRWRGPQHGGQGGPGVTASVANHGTKGKPTPLPRSVCSSVFQPHGAAGAAGDVPGHRLPRHALVLLRQPADEGVRRGEGHGAGLRGEVPAEDAQQRGLARAVGPHDADDVPRRDGEVERVEQRAVAVAEGHEGSDLNLGPWPVDQKGTSETCPLESEINVLPLNVTHTSFPCLTASRDTIPPSNPAFSSSTGEGISITSRSGLWRISKR